MDQTSIPSQQNRQPEAVPAAAFVTKNNPDELNLLEYAYVMVKHKWLIIGFTILGFILGYVTALIKGPEYVAEAVIAPREVESQKSPNLSGLGMFGGMVASQLNLGGNASLDKIEIILSSRKFNAELIENKNLLPLMYIDKWDTAAKKWEDDFVPPELLKTGDYLRKEFFKKEINKNNTMNIRVTSKDSLASYKMLKGCLEYLDLYIRSSVQEEAKENRNYLEGQLVNVTDPLLRAKIQELIASEVEKMMVVSKEAFKIVDPEYTSKNFKKKKLYSILFSFVFLFFLTIIIVFKHVLTSTSISDDDSFYLGKFRKELFKLPFSS